MESWTRSEFPQWIECASRKERLWQNGYCGYSALKTQSGEYIQFDDIDSSADPE